jgi:hypothetical protein
MSTLRSDRTRANGLFMASDVWLLMLKGLRDGVTVHKLYLDPLRDEKGERIEFEVVCTKCGATKLPRNTQTMVRKP